MGRAPGLEVKKYSEYFFERHPNQSLDSLNADRDVPLVVGDCDTVSNPRLGVTPEVRSRREGTLRKMKTFAAELDSGEYDAYYTPKQVIVLSTPWTFSSLAIRAA